MGKVAEFLEPAMRNYSSNSQYKYNKGLYSFMAYGPIKNENLKRFEKDIYKPLDVNDPGRGLHRVKRVVVIEEPEEERKKTRRRKGPFTKTKRKLEFTPERIIQEEQGLPSDRADHQASIITEITTDDYDYGSNDAERKCACYLCNPEEGTEETNIDRGASNFIYQAMAITMDDDSNNNGSNSDEDKVD